MVSGVNLTVQASNAGADPPLNTTVDVTITVLDINDNKPSFTSQIYTEMITENSATPAEILSLVATDIDQPMVSMLDECCPIAYCVLLFTDSKL